MKKSLISIYVIIMLIISGCYNTPSTAIINNEEISIKPIEKNSVAHEDVTLVTMLNEKVNEIINHGDVTVTLNGSINKPNTLERLCIYRAEIIDYNQYEENMLFLFGEYKDQVTRDVLNHLSVRADDGYSADIINSCLYDENNFTGQWGMLWFYEERKFVSEEEITVNMTNGEAKIKANEVVNQIGATAFEYDSCKYNKEVLQITPEGTLSSPMGDTISVNFVQKIQGVPLRSTLINNRRIPGMLVWFDSSGVTSVMITEYKCEVYGEIENLLSYEEALEKFIEKVSKDKKYNGVTFDSIKFEYTIINEYVEGKFMILAVPCWHFYCTEELDKDVIVNCTNGEVW